jgi:myb proto-oncogene protein
MQGKVQLKTCRWHNHLDPEINTSVWSEEDEQRLFEAHKVHGNRWKCISRLLEGR